MVTTASPAASAQTHPGAFDTYTPPAGGNFTTGQPPITQADRNEAAALMAPKYPTHDNNPYNNEPLNLYGENRDKSAIPFGTMSKTNPGDRQYHASANAVVDSAALGAAKQVYGASKGMEGSFTSGGMLETDKRTWNKVSDTELKALGMDPSKFMDNANYTPKIAGTGIGAVGFKSALYKSDRGEFTLAFAGTNSKSIKDLWTDAKGGAGFTPEQFNKAMDLGKNVTSALGDNVVFTGHSLGGGLASYAAIGSGAAATTFNPMDLTRNLISSARAQASPDSPYADIKPSLSDWGGVKGVVAMGNDPASGVRSYVQSGEFLDKVQSTGYTATPENVNAGGGAPTSFNDFGQKIVLDSQPGQSTSTMAKHSIDYMQPNVAQNMRNRFDEQFGGADGNTYNYNGNKDSLYPWTGPYVTPTT